MIKNLFFAVALLMPALAYAVTGSADLTIQVVPASGGGVPGPAAAAGFTTQVLDADFTSPAYSDKATFVANCGASSGPRWYWVRFLSTTQLPCGDVAVVPDPTDGAIPQVLSVSYTVADFQTGQAGLADFVWPQPAWSLTFPCNVWPAGCLPVAKYIEVVMRTTDQAWNQNGGSNPAHIAFDATGRNALTAGNHDQVETVWLETIGGSGPSSSCGGASFCAHSGLSYNFGAEIGGQFYSVDIRQYHTLGVLLTTDGSSALWQCVLIDGALPSGTSCVGGAMDVNNYSQHDNELRINLGQFNDLVNTFPVTVYLKSYKVWSCAAYQTGPCFGTMVTHWP